MIKNNKIKLIYRIILVLITYLALYLNFKFISLRYSLLYFTILSNLFVSIFFTIDVISILLKKDIVNEKYIIIKGAATLCITITMLVYNLVLTNMANSFEGHMLENNLVHIVVPLLTIFDYILFDKKNMLKKKYIFYWIIPLILYTIYLLIYILLGGKFIGNGVVPYPFLNFKELGYIRVVFNSIVILLSYMLIGYIFVFIDNKIKVK